MRRKLVIEIEAAEGAQETMAWCSLLFALAGRVDQACLWRQCAGAFHRPLGPAGVLPGGLGTAAWRVEETEEAGDVLARAMEVG